MWNCILFEKHHFYFDIEKQISMRCQTAYWYALLVNTVFFQESLQCGSSTILNLLIGTCKWSFWSRKRERALAPWSWSVESACIDGFLRCLEEGGDLETKLCIITLGFFNKTREGYPSHPGFLKWTRLCCNKFWSGLRMKWLWDKYHSTFAPCNTGFKSTGDPTN